MPLNISDGVWINTDLVCFTLSDGREFCLTLEDVTLLIETLPINTTLIAHMPSGAVHRIEGESIRQQHEQNSPG
jgi:hypothetical protein